MSKRTQNSGTTCRVHPDWCNQVHKPGANPNRQNHTHKFYPQSKTSTGTGPRRLGPTWISTFPCPTHHEFEPCFFFRLTAYNRQADIVLALSDFRALIADMSRMADVLEAQQALIDAKKVYNGVQS